MKLNKIILIAFVFSGMAALIYAVVWIRPLQFVFGSTIYTVSIIFAVFMAGLALGSQIISRYVDKIQNLPKAYALMELGIGLYGVLLLSLFGLFPDIYRAIYPLHKSFYVFEFFQFISIFGILLIPTTLMGATFPVVAKFYTKEKIGKGIGEIYSANNLGAIIGSFAAGFILIPILGIKSTIIFAGLINIFIAFLILSIVSANFAKKTMPVALVLFLAFSYFGNYKILNLYSGGFYRSQYPKELLKKTKFLYYKEGLHATIAVIKDPLEGAKALLINGKGQGSSAFRDLRVNLLLAYLPILLQPKSEKILVIGLGTGTTSGHLSQFKKVTTVEIEPAILGAAKHFKTLNLDVLENPNHNLVIADGRNYLLKSKEKFDIVVQEPSDPWQSFSTNLYSKEFFELVKNHLGSDGIFVKWIPIYTMSVNDFKNLYKTFNSVFPNTLAFANVKEDENFPIKLETTEIILLGSEKSFNKKEFREFRENFSNLPPEVKEEYLKAIWINSADDLLNLILFTSDQMKSYADGAKFITDDNAKLEFSTAKSVLSPNPKKVLSNINQYLTWKEQK
jgi:spermidine synthase